MKAGQCAKIGFNGIERGPSGSFFHDALNNTKCGPGKAVYHELLCLTHVPL